MIVSTPHHNNIYYYRTAPATAYQLVSHRTEQHAEYLLVEIESPVRRLRRVKLSRGMTKCADGWFETGKLIKGG